MNFIERVKNILISPKKEWMVINQETASPMSLFIGYVLPLAVIGSIGSILQGFLFPGTNSLGFFLLTGIISMLAGLVAYYSVIIVVDNLAPGFASEKDPGKSAQLVAYSCTPAYIASLFGFIPYIGGVLSILGWIYGIYLMYLGIGLLKKTPEEKKVVYIIVVYVVLFIIYFILIAILGAMLFASFGFSAMSGFRS